MTRARTAVALLLATTLAASGCGVLFRGSIPARSLYRLALPDSMPGGVAIDSAPGRGGGGATVTRAALDGTMGILRYETSGLYGESNIVYRTGDLEYASYPNREWALPLGEMLGLITARLATSSRLTRDVPF